MPKKLAPADTEWVLQTYVTMGNNINATARKCGFARETVRKIVKQAREESHLPTIAARAEATAKLARKIQYKTEAILESISPDDIASGRIPLYDPNNPEKIIGYKYFGPSLLQKMTSVGIGSDKVANLLQTSKTLEADAKGTALLVPEDAAALIEAISGKIESLQALSIRFKSDNPSLVAKVEDTIKMAQTAEIIDADVQSMDEFDGR